jgi:hypothetical protein
MSPALRHDEQGRVEREQRAGRAARERVYLDSAALLRHIGREELLPLAGVEGFAAAQMR